jgi:IclR family acetate operon transcriptional repressor
MSVVDKALDLLDLFSERTPELGLSEVARRAGRDKATALRLLAALQRHGFLEQHSESRKYRLGPSLLRLARVREATFPLRAVVDPVLDRLVRETEETAHCSLFANGALATIGLTEPARSTRVNMERGERLPLHATASGLAFLAFARDDIAKAAFAGPFAAITARTVVDPSQIRARLEQVRAKGSIAADQTYETEVYGIAAPLFGHDGAATGAVGVATPRSRITDALEAAIHAAVRRAAVDITRGLGGAVDPVLEQAVA